MANTINQECPILDWQGKPIDASKGYFYFDCIRGEKFHFWTPGQHIIKAWEFLGWVSREADRLKKAVAKNITYDPELFEDVFHDTVLKVHDRIERVGEPGDLKNYFWQ